MKKILSLIISATLVVSGYSQTRNVLVGTNNAVVQPTNFWSADASNARSGLGLGTAATNPASAFQPSSTTLSNLSLGNGSGLTNIAASAISSTLAISNTAGLQAALDSKLATNGSAAGLSNFPTLNQNTTGTASNVTGVVAIANGGTGSTNVIDARTALGLGTASTNPASAFQPSSTTLSNLAAGNGGGLTNITATIVGTNISITNIVGLQSALDSKLATNGSAAGLISFPTLNQNTTGTASNVTGVVALANGGTGSTNASDARAALGLGTAATSATTAFQPAASALTNLAANNGGGLTNLQATNLVGMIPASNISTITISNVGGTLPITQGGTGATNASGARTALELGTAATNPSTAFQAASSALTNLSSNNGASLTNLTAANITGTVGLASNITGTAPLATNVSGVVALANGGTAGTNATTARASLGATTIGANLFTLANPDDTRFIRLNANNSVSSLTAADMRTALSVGTNLGTVTSVGMTVPNIFSLSGSTITSSGTFALTLASQSSRQAFLVPNGGGIPAFRGIESDDLPSLAIAKISGLQAAIDGKLATNGTAPLAVNVTGTVAVANGGTGGTSAESGRTGLGATTIGAGLFTLANPSSVRFIRLNADNTVSSLSDSDFRTAIGLGTAATNSASSFQASSANLTSLATNNGANLTNISLSGVVNALASNGNAINLTNLTAANITGTVALASNVTGTIAISNGGSGAATAGGARTNLGLGAAWLTNTVASNFVTSIGALATNGNGFALTNLNASNITGIIPASNISSVTFSNLAGTLAIASGGTAATNAGGARTNLGLGLPALTNTNANNFRSAIGLGDTNSNVKFNSLILGGENDDILNTTNWFGPYEFFARSAKFYAIEVDGFLLTTTNDNLTLYSALYFGNTTNAAITRTNLGLGATWLTNTNATNFRSAIGLGDTNSVTFSQVTVTNTFYPPTFTSTNGLYGAGSLRMTGSSTSTRLVYRLLGATPADRTVLNAEDNLINLNSAPVARTNLGLGWSALTNTNTSGFNTSLYGGGTNPVLVSTSGEVVSPTNFWQVAPIQTLVQDLTVVVTSQTNNATNARNLYVYSLATNVSGISNTILLPTNAATFVGDEVTVIHQGTTNTTTVIREAGSTNNLITLNRFDEAVKFIRESGQWDFYHNISYVEPIQFSGTNASNNIAATRTNLGLGLPALTNSNTTNFQAAVFQTNTAPVSGGTFGAHAAWMEVNVITNGSNVSFRIPLYK